MLKTHYNNNFRCHDVLHLHSCRLNDHTNHKFVQLIHLDTKADDKLEIWGWNVTLMGLCLIMKCDVHYACVCLFVAMWGSVQYRQFIFLELNDESLPPGQYRQPLLSDQDEQFFGGS